MHFQLSQFLRHKRTESNLGTKCVSAMLVFSESLVEKELYLANYMRHTITNCMDSATTSPVESQNSIVHQKLGINSKTDTHRSVKLIAENSQQTITDHYSRALLTLNLTNKASKSPTRDYIASKSQSIADQNYDVCNTFCLAQITEKSWWCWNFDQAND